MADITLSRAAARRFILGKQGLWPGRRWRGKRGTERAMRAMEYLQLDPLQVAARSQDIALYGRVVDYAPGMWETLCYKERKFFDWGGWLAVRPMDELPYWRVVMRRERGDPRIRRALRMHRQALDEMRAAVRERRIVSNRDFAMRTRRRVSSYRGRKDSALALYYLWRFGELMTHHRERFERVYALAEDVAPAHLLRESTEPEADLFLIKKTIAFHGLHRLDGLGRGDVGNPVLSRVLRRPITLSELDRLRGRLLCEGDIVPVRVEGVKGLHYALESDTNSLRELDAMRTPRRWEPWGTSTREEATFLSPLDIVTARERARALFGFDYKWEVYTPPAQRKYGYYALPILWDDALVARTDLKFDRPISTLLVRGLWVENRATAADSEFAEALAKGVSRFMRFIGAERLDVHAVVQRSIRIRLAAAKTN